MADELHFYGTPSTQSGLTVIARIYDSAGAQLGSDVSCAEIGSLALYIGDMPSAGAGQYGIRFFESGETDPLSTGYIDWDGSAEVTLTTIAAQIAALNDFDPASDAVANVTLVATTTTNTDMRGTDGANTTTPNTVAPDNSGISAISAAIAALSIPTASENATAVEAAILNEMDGQQVIDAIVQAIDNENITAAAIASEVWSSAVDGSLEAQELMRLIASAVAGKVSVANGQFSFRDLADSKDRIVADTTATGERTSITLDAS